MVQAPQIESERGGAKGLFCLPLIRCLCLPSLRPHGACLPPPSLLMHACKWPCQYDLPLSLSLFPLLKLHGSGLPPLPSSSPPSLSSTSQPTSDSHAISCMCSGACVLCQRVCMICRKWLARDSFKCSRTLGKEGSCSN